MEEAAERQISRRRLLQVMGGSAATSLLLAGCICETWLELCGVVGENCDACRDGERGGKVYICPGDAVCIGWQFGGGATSVEITPDVGVVSSSPGSIVVHPTADTTYTARAIGGDCDVTRKLEVRVIKEGDTIDIQANPSKSCECWLYILPQTKVSQSIKVTSIEPRCGLTCYRQQPAVTNYPYLACGASTLCEGIWSLWKEDPNGQIHTVATGDPTTGPQRIGLNCLPLAGEYRFTPIGGITSYNGYAYFQLTVTCGECTPP